MDSKEGSGSSMRSCRQVGSVRIALFNASIVSSGSGSDWDMEATGAPPINARRDPRRRPQGPHRSMLDVTPGPVQMLFVGSEVSVTPDPILVFIVGEETGSISLPSAGALVWQTGSETNMASVPEST